jgi:hypothetical protein
VDAKKSDHGSTFAGSEHEHTTPRSVRADLVDILAAAVVQLLIERKHAAERDRPASTGSRRGDPERERS